MENYNEYLSHHGVKGMKWGIIRSGMRKLIPQSKKAKRKKEMRELEEKAKTLTNQQLRAAIERKKLQNEYISYYAPSIKKSRKAKIVESVINSVGEGLKTGIKSTAASLAQAQGKKIAAKYFNLELKDEKKK